MTPPEWCQTPSPTGSHTHHTEPLVQTLNFQSVFIPQVSNAPPLVKGLFVCLFLKKNCGCAELVSVTQPLHSGKVSQLQRTATVGCTVQICPQRHSFRHCFTALTSDTDGVWLCLDVAWDNRGYCCLCYTTTSVDSNLFQNLWVNNM